MPEDEVEVGVGPWVRPVAGRTTVRPRAARRGRPAQRGRPVPVLAARGDRGRPGRAPARLPCGDRELAARPQHRHGGPHRQRLPGPGRAHRRASAVEPARRHGDRPVPAPAPPRRPGRSGRLGAGGRTCVVVGVDNLPGSVPIETVHLPRRCVLLFGQEGPGLSDAARDAAGTGLFDRPVRLDPLDQRRGGQRHRDAHLDPPARRTAACAAERARNGTAGRAQNGSVSLAVSCPRCGGVVRPPDLMHSGLALRPYAARSRRCMWPAGSAPRFWRTSATGSDGWPAIEATVPALVPVAAASWMDGHRGRVGRR